MKKYMALALAVCLVLFAGCGKDESDTDTTETSTQTTTEYAEEDSTAGDEEITEENTDDETEARTSAEEKTEQKTDENSAERQSADFKDSEAYKALSSLAQNAGFELGYSGGIVTIRAYIDDESALRINSNDTEFESEWYDRCGLYDEFCSEAVRTLKNNNAGGTTVRLDVLSRTDNSLYYRNENGHGVFNAYESR